MMDRFFERFEPSPSLSAQAEAALDRKGWRLAFPPELEARYRVDLAADRAREFRNFFRIATALYCIIGVAMKLAGVTHENWSVCALQMVATASVAMAVTHFCFQPGIADQLREAAALACCLLASVAAILVSYASPGTTQDLIIAALPTNFILMFIRLRLPAAAAFALVSFSAYSASILLRPAAAAQDAFLITFMAILCLPALIGLHALERASRRLYLHGLLQHLHVERMALENDTLTVLCLTDPLTKVANRRRLDLELSRFCERNMPGGALLLIDVDRFKAFNDMYGHQAGDLCLQQVAARLSGHLRQCDLLARFGGEEFAVLLPSVAECEAAAAAERLRAAIQSRPFEVGGAQVYVTVSIGVAPLDAPMTPETLLDVADSALYAAKTAGRNQVHAYKAA